MTKSEQGWKVAGRTAFCGALCIALVAFGILVPGEAFRPWDKWDWSILTLVSCWLLAGAACYIVAWLKRLALKRYLKTHGL